MTLTIHNFAKIETADVVLDGITLISGANDSGKSTCGKVLCTLLTAINQIEKSSWEIRRNKIKEVLRSFTQRHDNGIFHFLFLDDEEVDKYLRGGISVEKFAQGQINSIYGSSKRHKGMDIGTLIRQLEEVRLLSEKEVRCTGLQKSFATVFHSQYMPLYKNNADNQKSGPTTVTLKHCSSELSIELTKNSSIYNESSGCKYKAWYLNDPSIVDRIGVSFGEYGNDWFSHTILKALSQQLMNQTINPVEEAFDDTLLKGKLSLIDSQFKRMNDDELGFSKSRGLLIKRKGFREGLLLSNASMGIKSLSLIRLLIKNRVISQGDILVLDEPEIHLHPEWQMIYAELLVLIWKELGIYVLLTTHSPDFTQAVRLYAKKHGVLSNVTAYLSVGTSTVRFEQLKNKDWDKLFDRFLPTVKMLENLAEEVDH